MSRNMSINQKIGLLLSAVAGIIALFLTQDIETVPIHILKQLYIDNYISDTGAANSVASIYLNYRIFDTIFEALMLLVSVMGVIHFSRHEGDTTPLYHSIRPTNSQINRSKGSTAIIIPIILLLGIYLTINGHITPGGGFQGGATLSSAFICIYLILPHKTINFFYYENLEKWLFLFIALTALLFAASNIYLQYPNYNIIYLVIMNILIGLKVFCGLSIIFYRFVHYEDI